MSTWYDVYCLTCKDHAGSRDVHADKECRELVNGARLKESETDTAFDAMRGRHHR